MINPFKKTTKNKAIPEEKPNPKKVAIMSDFSFFFSKGTELTYNENTNKYESTLYVPFFDENGDVVQNGKYSLSIDAVFITSGLFREHLSSREDYFKNKYNLKLWEAEEDIKNASAEERINLSNYMIEKWKHIAEL